MSERPHLIARPAVAMCCSRCPDKITALNQAATDMASSTENFPKNPPLCRKHAAATNSHELYRPRCRIETNHGLVPFVLGISSTILPAIQVAAQRIPKLSKKRRPLSASPLLMVLSDNFN